MTRNRCLAAALAVVSIVALVAYRSGLLHVRSATAPATDQSRPDLSDWLVPRGVQTLEARLTGGFAYGAIPRPHDRRRVSRTWGPDTRIAIAKIEKNAARSSAGADWLPSASYVVSGELEKGLQVLEAAVTTPVPDPAWLNDLRRYLCGGPAERSAGAGARHSSPPNGRRD
jgi:hypothetical protein